MAVCVKILIIQFLNLMFMFLSLLLFKTCSICHCFTRMYISQYISQCVRVCVCVLFIFLPFESFFMLISTRFNPFMLMLEFDQFFHTDEKCEATVAGFLNFKKAKALVEIWFPMIKVLKMYALNDQNDERTIHSKKRFSRAERNNERCRWSLGLRRIVFRSANNVFKMIMWHKSRRKKEMCDTSMCNYVTVRLVSPNLFLAISRFYFIWIDFRNCGKK